MSKNYIDCQPGDQWDEIIKDSLPESGTGFQRVYCKVGEVWGVSIVSGPFAYTDEAHPYEVAIYKSESIDYDNPLSDGDVIGYQTAESVGEIIKTVQGWAEEL